MHKIHDRKFGISDFSFEHLFDDIEGDPETESYYQHFLDCIDCLNAARESYLKAKIKPMKEESKRAGLMKKYWWQMIQLLPSSYNQLRTVQLNYQVLKSMYHARKNHKLDEWHEFCAWCEGLPYFKELCI